MMTSEQRYFFDTSGYLFLEGALKGSELTAAREAAQRYIDTPSNSLPSGFEVKGRNFSHGFAFDKTLEALAFHPKTWPIVKELTGLKPRLAQGNLTVNTHEDTKFHSLHCARDDWGPQTPRYFVENGLIYCDYFVVFFYLTDVFPGDGGLVVIPGSHKGAFKRPDSFFVSTKETADPDPHPSVLNLTPKAGDVVIIPELLTHGVLTWRPRNRDRRFLMLRYVPQFLGPIGDNLPFPFPSEILERLSPETRELIEFVPRSRTKEIVMQEIVTLS
ncbi:MAG: hypothetical protein DF168_02190 [Candidatus Moanabacter tarae]|uniref:Phytanoyl-CoA dioxygenase family protein n=1 Tax=Candidatus Moanibacter tarae TaxID=2200854 RepID=A0A2Z4AGX9_9BACT|nr:MAG: hypothetical protein DF168_02190 [Candidatus Moanabacter tarae]|tara:strand:- start:20882 stop:21700 length:819 start_codon:yes stop_codon:yes gene_type:complete